MGSILIDTNLLLDDPTILYKLKKKYDVIVIPITVLKELDKHKFNPDLSYSARLAINSIKEFKTKYGDSLKLPVNDDDISDNDSRIIRAAKDNNAVVATKDISMSIISECSGVDCKLYGNVANGVYNPYLYLDYDRLSQDFNYKNVIYGHELTDLFNKIFYTEFGFTDNEWFFIFISGASEGKKVVYANNPITKTLERIDNSEQYRVIYDKEKHINLKAKDLYQVCAIYALKCAPNVLLTGKWGSGKSLIATAACIAKSSKKIFISRPPIGISKKYDIGYLPGSKNDKMIEWFAGFISSLYFIFGNTRNQMIEDVEYDYIKESKFRHYFETMPINAIQGLSLLDGDTLCIDECQLLDIDTVSMVLSRGTQNSKIVLMGDLLQTYGAVKPSNSGLLKLLRALPHKSLAYVDLQTSYRSDILEIADILQDKTF